MQLNPIDATAYAALCALPKTARIGLAVSGGGDSMALLHSFSAASQQSGHHLEIASVDHKLRDESAQEAQFVAKTATRLEKDHTILDWEHRGSISGNLMETARRARYDLLAAWGKAQGLSHIALGHTADDQAETLLMGLGRAAGLSGLCGMRPSWTCGSLTFMRPFLMHSRAELRHYLMAREHVWIDDPSNENPRFKRIKMRQIIPSLAALGIDAQSMARSAQNLSHAENALEHYAREALTDVFTEQSGALFIAQERFAKHPHEIQRRIVLRALQWFSGAAHPPREAMVARFHHAILSQTPATLAGCQIAWWRGKMMLIRELNAADKSLKINETWDYRWKITGEMTQDMRIAPLGNIGFAQVKKWHAPDQPRAALLTTPALWRGQDLICAPMVAPRSPFNATIRPITDY